MTKVMIRLHIQAGRGLSGLQTSEDRFSRVKAHMIRVTPGSEVIKLFSCSIQLSTKFQLLIKTKITTNMEVSFIKSLRCCIYHAYKC